MEEDRKERNCSGRKHMGAMGCNDANDKENCWRKVDVHTETLDACLTLWGLVI